MKVDFIDVFINKEEIESAIKSDMAELFFKINSISKEQADDHQAKFFGNLISNAILKRKDKYIVK